MSIRHVRLLAAQIPDCALLARLRMPHLGREFSFSLKPVIQVMARLLTTFDVDSSPAPQASWIRMREF
jgi:hypothetical protein